VALHHQVKATQAAQVVHRHIGAAVVVDILLLVSVATQVQVQVLAVMVTRKH
jgi:hypothetical protein